MPSPHSNTVRVSGGAQDGLNDSGGEIIGQETSAFFAIFSKLTVVASQLIPFVNEEDFRSPL